LLFIVDSITLVIVAAGIPFVLGLLFLPTILELTRPCDLGPRIIISATSIELTLEKNLGFLIDIEEKSILNHLFVDAIVDAVSVLPCLEI